MMESPGRVIKRYANRKLYDTQDSRYVTLEQISEMIREGENVKVVDNNSKEDLTSVTLAQIIFEEEKKKKSFLPLAALRNIIQSGGDSLHELMNQLSEGAGKVGHIFRAEEDGEGGEAGEGAERVAEAEPKGDLGDEAAHDRDATHMFKDFMDGFQKTVDDWQKKMDTNIHQAVETVSPLAPLQKEIQTLAARIEELEGKLSQLEEHPAAEDAPADAGR